MRHMAKRALSLLLALLLCLSLFPAAALAEEGSISPVEDGENSGLSGTPAPTEEGKPGTIVGADALGGPSGDPAALIPEPASDEIQGIVSSGSCGENLTWTLDDTGLLTISGEGKMTNWSTYSAVPWHSNRTSIRRVLLKAGVTSIGKFAFFYCSLLSSVTIPETVKTIGESAFNSCGSLRSVTIPESVTSIGSGAFHLCSKLMSVTIPDSVTSIEDHAFSNCSVLTSVIIPDSVTTIGSYAFGSCIGLASVTMPNSVTSIARYAFMNCSGLTSVTIPDSVTHIGEGAFSNCSGLTSVTIPESVTYVAGFPFEQCSRLQEVLVAEGNKNYSSLDGILYDADFTTLIECPGGKNGAVAIPDTVTAIKDHAFLGCLKLARVTIPEGATMIGYEVFSGCSSLKTILFQGDAPSIRPDAFTDDCAMALYPIDNATWTEDVRQNYGGTLTWVGYRDEAEAYTIHYDPNGGNDAPEDQIKGHNVDITLTDAVPSWEDAAFLGWSTRQEANRPDYLPGDRFTQNADTTLYAVWKQEAPVLPTEAVLTVGSAKVCAGQEFTVELTMEKNPGLMYLSFRLDYDTASLVFLGAEDGLFTGWTVNKEKNFLTWDADGDRTDNGALLRLRFRAKEDAPTGETAIALAGLFATNYAEDLLGIGTVPGTVTILPHTPGDVNGDGDVDGRDLVRLRKYLVGIVEDGIVETNTNVNGDDVIDILDLVRLRKYLAQDKVILG